MRIGSFILLMTVAFCTFSSAESYISPKGGMVFPGIIRGLDVPADRAAWNAGIEWGGLGDAGIGGGASFDAIWKWNNSANWFDRKTTVYDSVGGTITSFEVDRDVRRTAFTLGGNLVFNPLSDFIVSPIIRGSFGPMMLIYINREYDDDKLTSDLTEHSGVYWGFLGRAGVDANFKISRKTSLFAGVEYHWSEVTKRKWGTRTRYAQDMSGVAWRIGFRFL